MFHIDCVNDSLNLGVGPSLIVVSWPLGIRNVVQHCTADWTLVSNLIMRTAPLMAFSVFLPCRLFALLDADSGGDICFDSLVFQVKCIYQNGTCGRAAAALEPFDQLHSCLDHLFGLVLLFVVGRDPLVRVGLILLFDFDLILLFGVGNFHALHKLAVDSNGVATLAGLRHVEVLSIDEAMLRLIAD